MNGPSLNTPYLVLSGVVIIAIVSVFFIFQPLVNDIGETREEIQRQSVAVQEREEFLRTIDRKLAELQGQQEHEQRLNVMLPVEDRVEDMLRIVHQSAQVAGVTVHTISDQSASAQSNINSQRARGEAVQSPTEVRSLALEMTYSGTYQQLRALLSEFEKSPRLINVTQLTIGRNDQATDSVTGSMQLVFYAQQPPSLADAL